MTQSSRVAGRRPPPNSTLAGFAVVTLGASAAAAATTSSFNPKASSGTSTSGRRPPMPNTIRQSRPGASKASRATEPPPSGMPLNIRAVTPVRFSFGVISLAMAMRLGMAPPMPTPVSRRQR